MPLRIVLLKGSNFAPQGTLDNVWGHSGWPHVGVCMLVAPLWAALSPQDPERSSGPNTYTGHPIFVTFPCRKCVVWEPKVCFFIQNCWQEWWRVRAGFALVTSHFTNQATEAENIKNHFHWKKKNVSEALFHSSNTQVRSSSVIIKQIDALRMGLRPKPWF